MSTPNPKIEGNLASAPPFLPQFSSAVPSLVSLITRSIDEHCKEALSYDADSEGSSDDEVEKAELEMLNAIAAKLKIQKASEEKEFRPPSGP